VVGELFKWVVGKWNRFGVGGGWLRIAVIAGSVTLSHQPQMGPDLQGKKS
jgi:hypothetical protein